MRKLSLISVLLCIVLNKGVIGQNSQVTVIPEPQEIVLNDKSFSLDVNEISYNIYVEDTSGYALPVNELKETLEQFKGINLVHDNSSSVIKIGLPAEDGEFEELCITNNIWPNEKIGEEGYTFLINDNNILIAANTDAGLYYGVQTLKQLIRGNKNNSSLPGVKIVDYPELKYRGLLDDISRGLVPTMDYMKAQIRRFAELKLNTMQYYTENVVMTKKHPAFAPPNGSITIDEWRELSDYANQYHVMLIGNFQSFGHFEKILATPEYKHLGEGGTLLSPAFPESIQLLEDIYKEMVPAFDAPFFNVNSDETFDLGTGASKQMVDSLGVAVVYTDMMKKMYNILKSLGVDMMMWCDIIFKHPESLDMLPKDIIMMTWGYDAEDSYAHMIEPVKNAGYRFTVSPGILNSYSTMPDFSISLPNIHGLVRDGIKYGSLGMVCTVWDDGGSTFFSRDWYAVAYAAGQSWNSTELDIEKYNKAFNAVVYADETENFTKAIWKLVSLAGVSPTDGLKIKPLWTKVIPDSGETIRVGLNDWDRVLAIVDSAEALLDNSSPDLHSYDLDYFRITVKQYRYFANLRINLIDAALAYKDAYENQYGNRAAVREQIQKASASIAKSINEANEFTSEYYLLWVRENETHWVKNILADYQNQIDGLRDIESRLYNALVEYDKHLEIPSPVSVRLGIEEGKGKYFREWMMINPVPIPDGSTEKSIDYLKEMGGELNARPKVALEFPYEGKTYRWRRTATSLFDVVDVTEEFPDEDSNAVTYAYANIDVPEDRIVKASLGSTDAAEVIINGKVIYTTSKSRPLKIDEDEFDLPLEKGRNHLMIKLYQDDDSDWKFTFRLPEYEVSSSKNRYKITE